MAENGQTIRFSFSTWKHFWSVEFSKTQSLILKSAGEWGWEPKRRVEDFMLLLCFENN